MQKQNKTETNLWDHTGNQTGVMGNVIAHGNMARMLLLILLITLQSFLGTSLILILVSNSNGVLDWIGQNSNSNSRELYYNV